MRTMYNKLLILLMFSAFGCVSYDKFDTSTAAGAFGMAEALEKDERYEEALIQYRSLKNRFPYSKYAVDSELQIAEVQYKKEAFAEAQGAYQLFKELHPRHPKIDYVTYQIGESIFRQLPSTVDRDLSIAPGAIREFEVLVRDFPQSKYVEVANKRRLDVLKKLAEKELYIADFYYRTKEWQHAIVRYEKFLKEFTTHSKRPHAYYRAGIAAEKFGNQSKRNTLFKTLIAQYPESKEAKKAQGTF